MLPELGEVGVAGVGAAGRVSVEETAQLAGDSSRRLLAAFPVRPGWLPPVPPARAAVGFASPGGEYRPQAVDPSDLFPHRLQMGTQDKGPGTVLRCAKHQCRE